MTPKVFWTYSLKIFGLYAIYRAGLLLPDFFSIIYYKTFLLIQILIFASFFVFFGTLGYFSVLKTNLIIDKLRLTHGLSDEPMNINIHRSSLLKIAIIVIGGLLVADSLPLLFSNLFQYFQNTNYFSKFKDNRSSPLVVLYLLKVIVGSFMVADSRLVVNFIERKRKN